jgi:flagellar basal-body rod modification protein FlgD
MTVDSIANSANSLSQRAGMPQAQMGKEEFLKLLIVQLSQQDPLNPQDSTEFVSQLATFTSLERLVNIEEGLGLVALASTATNSTLATGFIGKHVEIGGDEIGYSGRGSTELNFTLNGDASEVEIEITNEDGEVVRTIYTTGTSGSNTVVWDGKTDDGETAPTGQYTFSISKAEDEDGNEVTATTKNIHKVKSVTFFNGYPELLLTNGKTVKLSEVMAVVDSKSDSDSDVPQR